IERFGNVALAIAEVEVSLGGVNLALAGTASQSVTYGSANAQLAIDGNTNGNFSAGSVAATQSHANPWWELDLQSETNVDEIAVWARTDHPNQLLNFKLQLLDADRNVLWEQPDNAQPSPSVTLDPPSFAPTPGITIVQTGGETAVDEHGSSDAFAVVLDVQPASDVVLNVASDDTSEFIVDQQTLVFTPANWNVLQTVRVTGIDDRLSDGDILSSATVTVDPTSDAAFTALAATAVSVTVADNEFVPARPRIVRIERSGSVALAIAEVNVMRNGVNLALAGTATLSSPYPGAAAHLAIDGNTNGNLPVGGSVAATHSHPNPWWELELPSDTEIDEITVWARTDYPNQLANFTLQLLDADRNVLWDTVDQPQPNPSVTFHPPEFAPEPGIAVAITGDGTTVSENGDSDSFTVALTRAPASDVTVNIASGDAGEFVLDQSTLTFTPSNWIVPQTVTVTGVDDASVDGDIVSVATLFVDNALSDAQFHGAAVQSVSVLNTDNEYVTPLPRYVRIMRSGRVALAIAEVQVIRDGVNLALGGAATQSSTYVNWQLAVNSIASLAIDNNTNGVLTTDSVAATLTQPNPWWEVDLLTDTEIDEITVWPRTDHPSQLADFTIQLLDADRVVLWEQTGVAQPNPSTTFHPPVFTPDPGITVVKTNGTTTVSEDASTDTFAVSLDVAPASDVVVNLVSNDTSEFTVDQASLTFTPLNWNTPQTVTVTGVDDPLPDGDITGTVTLSIDVGSSDSAYTAVANVDTSVVNEDNEYIPPQPHYVRIERYGSTALAIAEVQVMLDDVNLALSGTATQSSTYQTAGAHLAIDNNTNGLFSGGSVTGTLTQQNPWWELALADDTEIDQINVWVRTDYPGQLANFTLKLLDVDRNLLWQQTGIAAPNPSVALYPPVFAPSPGITIVESGGGTTVSEDGTTDTFTVALDVAPTSDVIVNVSSGDPGEFTVDQAALTFTATNWNVPQTVTVTGVDDPLPDGDIDSPVTLSVDADHSDASYSVVADVSTSVLVEDNEYIPPQPRYVRIERYGSTALAIAEVQVMLD
ncbi:MAG: discoidin domain-containing protein, partial [Pirellulales bacterium]|nr:discoidin domain-containing protein [Pirellulales bacterium]